MPRVERYRCRRKRAIPGRAGRAGLAGLLLLAAACANDEREPSADAGAEGRYVAQGDEGLGASVAILLDNSGSMDDAAPGDPRSKHEVAKEALEAMIAATDSFVAGHPDFPVNVGLYAFASDVAALIPVSPFDAGALRAALAAMPGPVGGTAIGDAMDVARADLYRAGTIRKYILVVTDGKNTDGRSPERVGREIARRSEGAVRQYFIAFDIDAEAFGFLREIQGEVLAASNGAALRASLDTLYRGRILAEAVDAGETLPAVQRDSGSDTIGASGSSTTPGTKRP